MILHYSQHLHTSVLLVITYTTLRLFLITSLRRLSVSNETVKKLDRCSLTVRSGGVGSQFLVGNIAVPYLHGWGCESRPGFSMILALPFAHLENLGRLFLC